MTIFESPENALLLATPKDQILEKFNEWVTKNKGGAVMNRTTRFLSENPAICLVQLLSTPDSFIKEYKTKDTFTESGKTALNKFLQEEYGLGELGSLQIYAGSLGWVIGNNPTKSSSDTRDTITSISPYHQDPDKEADFLAQQAALTRTDNLDDADYTDDIIAFIKQESKVPEGTSDAALIDLCSKLIEQFNKAAKALKPYVLNQVTEFEGPYLDAESSPSAIAILLAKAAAVREVDIRENPQVVTALYTAAGRLESEVADIGRKLARATP